jgi:hypothetical protein
MAARLSTLRAGRFLPPGRFLVLISVRGWVDPRATVRLEGLGKLNISTSSGIQTGDLIIIIATQLFATDVYRRYFMYIVRHYLNIVVSARCNYLKMKSRDEHPLHAVKFTVRKVSPRDLSSRLGNMGALFTCKRSSSLNWSNSFIISTESCASCLPTFDSLLVRLTWVRGLVSGVYRLRTYRPAND